MAEDRLLLDTFFIQGLLNRRDRFHGRCKALLPQVRAAKQVLVTEAVLLEVAAALGAVDRSSAARFIRRCYVTPNIQVVTVDTPLLIRGLTLYESRPDKAWSLTDCISFVVMEEHGITEAATGDRHFVQAGYRALLAADA